MIRLLRGTHVANLHIRAALTITAEPGARLDGGGRGSVIRIDADGIAVKLEGFEVTGGAGETGSGILVDGYARVEIDSLSISGNARGKGLGAGLTARRGQLTISRTNFASADDVVVTNTAEVVLRDSRLDGELRVLDGAKVRIEGGSISGQVTIRGTTTRQPTLTIAAGTEVADVAVDPVVPGHVERE